MTLPNDLPSFQDKVVGVQVKDMPHDERRMSWWWMQSPSLHVQAGRLFLTGDTIAVNPNMPSWTDGVLLCVPWENVLFYTVETLENFRENNRRLANITKPSTGIKEERRGWWS